MRAFWLTATVMGLLGCGDAAPPEGPCANRPPAGCVDETHAFTCVNDHFREQACGPQQACAEAQCRDHVCQPNLFVCNGAVTDVCDATGTIETKTDCGATGGKCVVGALTAMCAQLTCTPLQTFCAPDKSEVRKCSGDGLGFVTVQVCSDPGQRGNQCAGSTCRDRCALVESQDRSTLGCRFVGLSESGTTTVLVANPQPDLDAQVTIKNAAGAANTTRTVAASSTMAIAWTGLAGSGTSQAARALFVTSTLPVYVWVVEAGDGFALHPEHALSASYLGGLDATTTHVLSVAGTSAATSVSVAVTGAVAASSDGTIPATAAGGTIVRTLNRGDVLRLASSAPLNGTRVTASAPVALVMSDASGSASLPGADALGQDAVVLDSALVVARDAATVTTEKDGTLTLAAGAWQLVSALQRLTSTAPILVVEGAAGREVIPPVEQWRSTQFPPSGGGGATWELGAAAPLTVGGFALTPAPSGTFAHATVTAPAPGAVTAASPFYVLVRNAPGTLPGAFGLTAIHP